MVSYSNPSVWSIVHSSQLIYLQSDKLHNNTQIQLLSLFTDYLLESSSDYHYLRCTTNRHHCHWLLNWYGSTVSHMCTISSVQVFFYVTKFASLLNFGWLANSSGIWATDACCIGKSSPRILKAIFLRSLLRKSLWKLCGFVTSEVWWPLNGRSHKQAWNSVFFFVFFSPNRHNFFHPSSATCIAVDYIFCWIYISQWLQWIAEKLMGITRQTARLCSSGLSHRFSKTKQQCFTALY